MKHGAWGKVVASTIVLTTMVSPLAVSASTGGNVSDEQINQKTIANNINDPQYVIDQAKALGLMVGDETGAFHPTDYLTRVQLAKILCTLFGLNVDHKQGSSFADVAANNWGLPYIEAVHQAGIMSGDGKTFRPNDQITREEMAVVLVKALGLSSAGQEQAVPISDQDAVHSWAQDAVQTVLANGLMEATNGTFSPHVVLNRQEVAAIVVSVVDHPVGAVQVGDGVVKIAGITYQVPDALRGLFSTSNADILKDAKLGFDRDGYHMTALHRLELQQPDGVLDGQGAVLDGDLIVHGSVTVKNLTTKGKLQINAATTDAQTITPNATTGTTAVTLENVTLASVDANATDVQLNAKGTTHVADVVVHGNATLTSDGTGAFDQLRLEAGAGQIHLQTTVTSLVLGAQSHPQITLSNGAEVHNVTLPSGVNARDIFANYDAVKGSVKEINGSTNPDNIVVSNPSPVQSPIAQLTSKIQTATLLKKNAKVGTAVGMYPQEAVDALGVAIDSATAVKDNEQATKEEILDAVTALNDAINTFKNAVTANLKLSLQPSAQLVVNPSLASPNVELVTGQTIGFQYNKQSIKSFIQIKRGAVIADDHIVYNPAHQDYDVEDSESNVIGELSVSSSNTKIELQPALDNMGLNVHPLSTLTEGAAGNLIFKLHVDGTTDQQVSVPIKVDETKPHLTSPATYAADTHTFTLTTNEPVAGMGEGTVQVQLAPTGDFTDTDSAVYLSNGVDFNLVHDEITNKIQVQLTQDFIDAHPIQAGSAFRFSTSGYTDLGNNPIDDQVTVDYSLSQY